MSVSSKFSVGEIVWAKVKGHPSWPATVVSFDELPSNVAQSSRRSNLKEGKKVAVSFFGPRGEYALLPASAIEAYTNRRANMKENKIPAKLKSVIKEADEEIAKRKQNQSSISQEDNPAVDSTTNSQLENSQMDMTSHDSMTTYGIIGLGNLSQIMLENFLNSGHDCIIWDIELSKGNIQNPSGRATVATSPGEVIRTADITFCYMDNEKKAAMMVYGADGVLESMTLSKGYVEMSQLDQDTSMRISASIEDKGGRYLEAQTIYFPGLLEKVQGVTFLAGNQSLFNECVSAFSCFSSNVYYFGQVGVASLTKILLSSLCNNMASAFGESFSLAQRCGLNMNDFAETVNLCLPRQVQPLINLMLSGQDLPNKKMVVEQRHLQKVAFSVDVPTPVLSATTQSLLAKLADQ